MSLQSILNVTLISLTSFILESNTLDKLNADSCKHKYLIKKIYPIYVTEAIISFCVNFSKLNSPIELHQVVLQKRA